MLLFVLRNLEMLVLSLIGIVSFMNEKMVFVELLSSMYLKACQNILSIGQKEKSG
jgi:hypothetical protein